MIIDTLRSFSTRWCCTLCCMLCTLLLLGTLPACQSEPSSAGPDAQAPSSQVSSSPSTLSADEAVVLPPDFSYPASDTVRLATWNVEHFVDDTDNPYIDNSREDNPPAGMEARTDRFVEAIRAMDADIVVLQEFESEAFAQELAETRFPEMNYRFFTSTESPTWYMNVVLMSRVPLGVVRGYSDVTTPIVGDPPDDDEPNAQSLTNHRMWLADVFVRPDYTLHLVGAHLKAGRSDRDAGWRTGQIRFLHTELNRLLEDNPNANIAIAGDLNALPDSPELRLLINQEERLPDAPAVDPSGWNAVFVNPLAGRDTYTHPADGPNGPERQLDYVLVNEAMVPELVEASATVALPLPLEQMAATSDHLPVVLTFVAEDRQPQ